jgi:hypothetical protein
VLGLIAKDAGNGVTYSYFEHGHSLYTFDLTPSLLDGHQFKLAKSGPLSLKLELATITSVPLQVMVYAELDSIIEESKTRQVLLNYV